jgi:hypothetical protein
MSLDLKALPGPPFRNTSSASLPVGDMSSIGTFMLMGSNIFPVTMPWSSGVLFSPTEVMTTATLAPLTAASAVD